MFLSFKEQVTECLKKEEPTLPADIPPHLAQMVSNVFEAQRQSQIREQERDELRSQELEQE